MFEIELLSSTPSQGLIAAPDNPGFILYTELQPSDRKGVRYSAPHSPDVPGIPIWEMNEINSTCCYTLTYG